MRLTAKHDVEVPIAGAFAAFGDPDAWEREALRRGADVTRTDDGTTGLPAWIIGFVFRGRPRQIAIRQTAAEPPLRLAYAGEGQLYSGTAELSFIDLGPRRTRVHLVMEVKPRSISARLILQTLRLNRKSLDRKVSQRFGQVATAVEDRYRRKPGA